MGHITPQGWIAIGVAAFGAVFSVVMWLIKRRLSRLDALEAAVFGHDGVKFKLMGFVTHEALDKKLEPFNRALNGLSEEGRLREERILGAIGNQTLVIGSEMREIKEDIREQRKRVDTVIDRINDSR